MSAEASPLLLVLNSAEGALQLALARFTPARPCGGSGGLDVPEEPSAPPLLLTAQTWHAPSQGAELLAPALSFALSRLNLAPKDLTHIACVRGPGSFTGLRLALATASGLARTTGARLAGMPYLRLLAATAAEAAGAFWGEGEVCDAGEGREGSGKDGARAFAGAYPPGGRFAGSDFPLIWVATHARRNLVHLQGFSPEGSGVAAVTELLVLSPGEGARHMAARGRPGLLLGSGHTRNREAWEAACAEAGARVRGLSARFDVPSWDTMLAAAAALEYGNEDIAPLYARPCDAEENLESIARSLGLDPAAARNRLDELT